MISFFIGLAVVALVGGAVVRHAVKTPTSTKRPRAERGARKPRAPKTRARVKAGARAIRARAGRARRTPRARPGRGRARRFVQWVRDRPERARARALQVHAAAKKLGRTAATRAGKTVPSGAVLDRPGWRAAWSDLRGAFARRDPAPPPGPITSATPASSTSSTSSATPAEANPTTTQGGPVSDTPKPTPAASAARSAPSLAQLFEISDQAAALPFESLLQIKSYLEGVRDGTERIAAMYGSLSGRMQGPMSIDRIVTDYLDQATALQRGVGAAVGQADAYLTMLLNASPQELMERGIRVPRAALINGVATNGRALIPAFYETASTLAGRAFRDLRGVHALIISLGQASEGQHALYRRLAARLSELRVGAGASDSIWTAATKQQGVTSALGDCDNAFARLLNMTLRELATSTVRAPEVHLEGV